MTIALRHEAAMNRSVERMLLPSTRQLIAWTRRASEVHWGSCAEYLHNTVSHLEALGIHDRNLWRLQALVAERITSLTAGLEQSKPAQAQIEPASTM